MNLFLPELGHLVTEADICCALRQEVRLLLGEEDTDMCTRKCVWLDKKSEKTCY